MAIDTAEVIARNRTGDVVAVSTIDADDSHVNDGVRWTLNDNGYLCRTFEHQHIYLHRLLARAQPHQYVDHINGDALDNRKANLRCVTPSGNMQNRKGPTKRNKCGVRGVSWHVTTKRWYGRVQLNKKVVWRQFFTDLDTAARETQAARDRFGVLNGADSGDRDAMRVSPTTPTAASRQNFQSTSKTR